MKQILPDMFITVLAVAVVITGAAFTGASAGEEAARHLINVLLAAVERSGAALAVTTHDPDVAGRMRTV